MKEWTTEWLERIGIHASPEPTESALRKIVGQQLRSIPFENLTVLCGNVPALDRAALAHKVVVRRRGGYCFELNGLLSLGLDSLGFEVRPVLARVLWQRSAPGPRTHLVLRVQAEGATWLADAGFGGPCPDIPIPIGSGAAQSTPKPYTLTEEPGLGTVLSRRMTDGRNAPLYCFQEEHVSPSDIVAANWLAATFPGSIFRNSVIMAAGDGAMRRTLDGRRYSRIEEGVLVEERMLGTAASVTACIADEFGLPLNSAEREAIARTVGVDAAR